MDIYLFLNIIYKDSYDIKLYKYVYENITLPICRHIIFDHNVKYNKCSLDKNIFSNIK